MSLINRKNWKFKDFLKKYWWIEFLAVAKIIYFVSEGFYNMLVGLLIVFGVFVILWILYRLGLE